MKSIEANQLLVFCVFLKKVFLIKFKTTGVDFEKKILWFLGLIFK
jgi:hypothetical protein